MPRRLSSRRYSFLVKAFQFTLCQLSANPHELEAAQLKHTRIGEITFIDYIHAYLPWLGLIIEPCANIARVDISYPTVRSSQPAFRKLRAEPIKTGERTKEEHVRTRRRRTHRVVAHRVCAAIPKPSRERSGKTPGPAAVESLTATANGGIEILRAWRQLVRVWKRKSGEASANGSFVTRGSRRRTRGKLAAVATTAERIVCICASSNCLELYRRVSLTNATARALWIPMCISVASRHNHISPLFEFLRKTCFNVQSNL